MVIRNCRRAGIFWQGLRHDLSKYSPTEFRAGAKYYLGSRSPNEAERRDLGCSLAWMHHKGRNRHHFEYWTDYNLKTHRMEPVKMPLRYVVEMFCDRVAAGRIYNGDSYSDQSPLEYFERAKNTRQIHPETSELIESFLTELSEKGEEETFKTIRAMVKEDRKNRKTAKNDYIGGTGYLSSDVSDI